MLTAENLKLRRDYKVKEEEVSAKMAHLNAECDLIQADRAAFEGKQAQFVEHAAKAQKKLEQEMETRMLFEQKLNSLHHINNEHESNHTILAEKLEALKKQNEKLTAENE